MGSTLVAIQGEYVITYSKTAEVQLLLEGLSQEYLSGSYNEPTDRYPLGRWRPVPLTVSKGLSGGGYTYRIKTPNGNAHERLWAYPEESYKRLLKENRVYFGKGDGGIPQRVIYDFESRGKPTSNYWDDVATNKEGKKEIIDIFGDSLFDTPKPVALVKKFLRLSTNKDSLVLDSFAGSGTTGHAVFDLNKEDGGNRKFILVEMEDDVAKKITAERIKRTIKKYDYKDGFEYCELAKPLFNERGQIDEACTYEELASYIYFTETQTNIDGKLVKDPFVGESHGKSYYLIYAGKNKNDLTRSALKNLKIIGPAVVYADRCLVDEEDLRQKRIVFKQIPYEIKVY